ESLIDHIVSPEALAIRRMVIGEGERFPELARFFGLTVRLAPPLGIDPWAGPVGLYQPPLSLTADSPLA
ncbi:MAG TPA: TetR/AcrR family transcriptional regulator C-terminal domain-containing protein, partial [Caulobacteraceae bacterium]|nr:TetR/AcrR family transcriptional regulator C-terminal domain-containing protein [Caulobacteraceae bacterium]